MTEQPSLKERIVASWFLSGLQDLYFAFRIDSLSFDFPVIYPPFLCSIGFEKICKAYLLALNSAKYENLQWQQAKAKVDSMVRRKEWGHDFKNMVLIIRQHVNDPDPESILNHSSDVFSDNHKTVLEAMEAAYLECRYPVPYYFHEKFQVASLLVEGHPGVYDDPIGSIDFVNFCAPFAGKISKYLKEKFDISISKNEFNRVIAGEAGTRFCNLYLGHFDLRDE